VYKLFGSRSAVFFKTWSNEPAAMSWTFTSELRTIGLDLKGHLAIRAMLRSAARSRMAAAAGAAAVLGLLAVVVLSRQLSDGSSEVSMLSSTDLVMPPAGVHRAGLEKSEFTRLSSHRSCARCWRILGYLRGKSPHRCDVGR
jgi:hypothetical protein